MPRSWRFWVMGINEWPLVYILGMGVIGAFAAIKFRRAPWAGRAARLITGAVIAGVLALHLLTAWVLAVDPMRNTGDIPLPIPFPSVASALLMAFIMPGLFWQGLLLGSLARESSDRRSAAWRVGYLFAAGYSVWVLPWALGIIID